VQVLVLVLGVGLGELKTIAGISPTVASECSNKTFRRQEP